MKITLKVPQKDTLEMEDGETKAVFLRKENNILVVFASNLTEKKEKSWREIAKIVLLGPNYKQRR